MRHHLIAFIFVLLAGCDVLGPAATIERTLPPTTGTCAVSLTEPMRADDTLSGIGRCAVVLYDGAPGNQRLGLYSDIAGVHVQASIARHSTQREPIEIGAPDAIVWDWTRTCSHWSGVLTWSDLVVHDEQPPYSGRHYWTVSMDATCDDDGYRVVAAWSGEAA